MPLTCPEETNFAAIAKQMHLTALEAEQQIFDLEQLLRSATNRPTMVFVSTNAVTGLTANIELNIGSVGGASFSPLFNNTTSQGPPDDSTLFQTLGEGMYEIGLYANMIPSGAVLDNSSRYFTIAHVRPDPSLPSGLARITESTQHLLEPNAGVGVDCCVVLTCRAQRGDAIQFLGAHSNNTSTVNVPVGTLVFLTKLSDATVVTVV